MNLLLAIVVIVAIALLLVGGLVQSLQFLVWVGIVFAIVAIIVALARFIRGRNIAG